MLDLPALRRLRGRGPWVCTQDPDGGVAIAHQRGATAWGPERIGVGGIRYQLADPLPPFVLSEWLRTDALGEWVRLRCGVEIPVMPAAADGMSIGLDGTIGAPVTPYGILAARVFDRIAALGPKDAIPWTDPDLLALARGAIMSCTTLTDELVHAFCLISTGDLGALFDAAVGLPKADGGAPGSPAAPPASTPQA